MKRSLSQTAPTATPMYSRKEKQRSARCCMALTSVSVFAGNGGFYTLLGQIAAYTAGGLSV